MSCAFERRLAHFAAAAGIVVASLVLEPGVMLVFAAGPPGARDYEAGIAAYKARTYAPAAQCFQRAIAAGNKSLMTEIYLGHSYQGAGDTARATEAYRAVADKYPSTAEGQLAIQCLLKMDPALSSKYHLAPFVPGPGKLAPDARTLPLIERIIIVPPLEGHPAVSASMIAAVRAAILKYPRHIYKYLEDGGATINLAPNIEDRWPGSGDGKKETVKDGTMGEEPGRTYGRDCYVYEREKVRGKNVLKAARSTESIIYCLDHEIGHAIDDISGALSKTPEFMVAMKQDLSRMPQDVKDRGDYFVVPAEAFAESTGVLLSGDTNNEVVQYLPMVRSYLRKKFRL